jgi:proteasome lid subunit RPN8/RPN11
MIKLNKNIKKDIRAHSAEEYPNECCGLIIENEMKERLSYRCQNISPEKDKHFEIDARSYLKASKIGEIKAYYHSHPGDNNDFSGADKAVSKAHELPLIMYFLKENEFFVYEP